MRKFAYLLVALLLVVGSTAYGVDTVSDDNMVILGGFMGSVGTTAATEVIKVYDNDTGTGNSQYLAMVWDTSGTNGTGYYVKRASQNTGQAGQTQRFAGVMLSPSSKDGSATGVGYMAIRGRAPCKVTGTATAGNRLTLGGATSSGRLRAITVGRESNDVGTALKTGTTVIIDIMLN